MLREQTGWSRRQLVAAAAAAAMTSASTLVTSPATPANADTTEIDVPSTIKTIDVHSHILPSVYLEGLAAQGVDPFDEDGYPVPSWSLEDHLSFMDEAGIDQAVVSISTPHIHHGDNGVAVELARAVNEETSAICARSNGRLHFAACLPMPCVEESVAEVAYAFDELGAVGIKVASNSSGVYLGDHVFDPLFEELERRSAVVNIHPSTAPAVPQNTFTAGPAPLFEYIADTTRAVLNLIATNTLERYPHVRVIVPHCGSFLPTVIHRMVGMSKVLAPMGLMEEVDVMGNFGRLYFDLAGAALPVGLDSLLKVADPSHIMYGGDFPYTPTPMIAQWKQDILNYGPIAEYRDAIFHANAEELYGF